MEALDASIRHLLSLEAPLNAWAAHSAQAEASLVSAAGRSRVDSMLAELFGCRVPLRLPYHIERQLQNWNVTRLLGPLCWSSLVERLPSTQG